MHKLPHEAACCAEAGGWMRNDFLAARELDGPTQERSPRAACSARCPGAGSLLLLSLRQDVAWRRLEVLCRGERAHPSPMT